MSTSVNFKSLTVSALIGGALGAMFSSALFLLLTTSSPKFGSINNKSIFAEQARRLADIKAQTPETQVKSLADTIESYARAVREVSKSYNVILLDQTAVATNLPDYTSAVKEKIFDEKVKVNE